MHLQNIDKIVETMRHCLSLGKPVRYSFIRDGIRFNSGSHIIRSIDELATFRASLLLREAVEGEDDAPEDYS